MSAQTGKIERLFCKRQTGQITSPEWTEKAEQQSSFYSEAEQWRYGPGGGGGGRVGVPVLGGRAGGTSGLLDWLSS